MDGGEGFGWKAEGIFFPKFSLALNSTTVPRGIRALQSTAYHQATARHTASLIPGVVPSIHPPTLSRDDWIHSCRVMAWRGVAARQLDDAFDARLHHGAGSRTTRDIPVGWRGSPPPTEQ